MVCALLKTDATQACYQELLGYYNTWLADNFKADNLYPQHTEVMKSFARHRNIPFAQGLFRNEGEMPFHLQKSRVVVKDQWASHPSTQDRVAHLRKLNVPSQPSGESAWSVFRNPEELQKQMTARLYDPVKFAGPPVVLDATVFADKLQKEDSANVFDKRFRGFYDQRNITAFDAKEILQPLPGENGIAFDDLFTDAFGSLPAVIRVMEEDLALLQSLESAKVDQSFDFDGVKYKRRNIPEVKEKLNTELLVAKSTLESLDKKIFRTFYRKAEALGRGEEVLHDFETIQASLEIFNQCIVRFQAMMGALQPIYSQMQPPAIKLAVSKIKTVEEPYREMLKQQLADPVFRDVLSKGQKDSLDKYLSEDWIYYYDPDYHQTNLNRLNESLQIFITASIERNFRIKKRVLEKQLELFV
jgi:hypothetical protein